MQAPGWKKLRRYGLPALWLLSAALVAAGGRTPGYWEWRDNPDPPYPLVAVLAACLFTAGETLLLYVLLRPRSYSRNWRRTLLSLGVFVPWFVLASGRTDMPGYLYAHAVWLFLVCLVLLGLLFVSTGAVARLRMQARRERKPGAA